MKSTSVLNWLASQVPPPGPGQVPLAAVEKLNSNLVLFPGLNAVESVTSNTAESVDESSDLPWVSYPTTYNLLSTISGLENPLIVALDAPVVDFK